MSIRPIVHDALARTLGGPARWLHKDKLRVLMFHGFTDRDHAGIENCQHKHLHVSKFAALLAHLSRHYRVMSLDEVTRRLRNGEKLPANAAVLTFDDGFLSNHTLAFPLLKQFNMPATIYLATEFVDEKKPIWVDRLDYALNRAGKSKGDLVSVKRRLKALPQEEVHDAVRQVEEELGFRLERADDPAAPAIYHPLNWDQVREMSRTGLVSFGAHTHSHVILGRSAPAVIRAEMQRCKAIIERETGGPCRLFCYPNGDAGDFSEISEQIIREQGFQSSVITVGGFNDTPRAPFLLRRLGMTNDLSPAQAEQYLSHGDASFRGLFGNLLAA